MVARADIEEVEHALGIASLVASAIFRWSSLVGEDRFELSLCCGERR
jgi:hypothetical protein